MAPKLSQYSHLKGHPFREWLMSHHMSIQTAARALGYTPSYLSNMLLGHKPLNKRVEKMINDFINDWKE